MEVDNELMEGRSLEYCLRARIHMEPPSAKVLSQGGGEVQKILILPDLPISGLRSVEGPDHLRRI
jgi:hypothetical protein